VVEDGAAQQPQGTTAKGFDHIASWGSDMALGGFVRRRSVRVQRELLKELSSIPVGSELFKLYTYASPADKIARRKSFLGTLSTISQEKPVPFGDSMGEDFALRPGIYIFAQFPSPRRIKHQIAVLADALLAKLAAVLWLLRRRSSQGHSRAVSPGELSRAVFTGCSFSPRFCQLAAG
jgi:hypothetical protein